jgi:predicted HAD superfamily phosphohydrolase YqeG
MDILNSRDIKENDAVMFDIDDTLIRSVDGSLIIPVVNLLHGAKSLGYKIVIITARPYSDYVVEHTTNQLKVNGITYDALGFAPPDQKGKMKRDLKFNFILSVGDMPTDLTDSEYGILV